MPTWTPEYSVNNSTLDDQHKKLFMILGRLSEAVQQRAGAMITPILVELEAYTIFHFSFEEHELEKVQYPDLDNHKKEHEKFRKKLKEFKGQLLSRDQQALKNIEDYLVSWIKNHIRGLDKKYVPYQTPSDPSPAP